MEQAVFERERNTFTSDRITVQCATIEKAVGKGIASTPGPATEAPAETLAIAQASVAFIVGPAKAHVGSGTSERGKPGKSTIPFGRGANKLKHVPAMSYPAIC